MLTVCPQASLNSMSLSDVSSSSSDELPSESETYGSKYTVDPDSLIGTKIIIKPLVHIFLSTYLIVILLCRISCDYTSHH